MTRIDFVCVLVAVVALLGTLVVRWFPPYMVVWMYPTFIILGLAGSSLYLLNNTVKGPKK